MTTYYTRLRERGALISAMKSWVHAIAISIRFRRLLKFGAVGCSGVVVNTIALFTIHDGLNLPLVLATPMAVEIAIVNNFCWNRYWTFAQRSISLAGAFLKYNASCFAGLVICAATLELLIHATDMHYLAANLIGIGLAAGSNFLLSNSWAWREVPLASTLTGTSTHEDHNAGRDPGRQTSPAETFIRT